MAPIRVAVAGGTGGLGKFVAEAFAAAAPQYDTIVLSRKGGSGAAPEGTTLVQVDYDDVEVVAAALKGVDIVVSLLGATATGDPQFRLLEAALKAGVRRFIPSSYGVPMANPESKGFLLAAAKTPFHDKLKASPIEWTIIDCGFFTDTTLNPSLSYIGWDLASGKAAFIGPGDQPMSLTTRADVGRWTVVIAGSEKAKNRTVLVAADTKTPIEIVKVAESITGKRVEVTRRSYEEVEASIKAGIEAGNFAGTIGDQVALAGFNGASYVRHPDNDEFALAGVTTIEAYLKDVLAN